MLPVLARTVLRVLTFLTNGLGKIKKKSYYMKTVGVIEHKNKLFIRFTIDCIYLLMQLSF